MKMNQERVLGLFRELADFYLEMHEHGSDTYTTLEEDELNAAETYIRRKLTASEKEGRGKWKCPDCGAVEWRDYETLARSGGPMCKKCAGDMEFVAAAAKHLS